MFDTGGVALAREAAPNYRTLWSPSEKVLELSVSILKTIADQATEAAGCRTGSTPNPPLNGQRGVQLVNSAMLAKTRSEAKTKVRTGLDAISINEKYGYHEVGAVH